MRIQFAVEGGLAYFPGMSRPVTITSDELTPEGSAELAELIDKARFFEQPSSPASPPRGAADYQQYLITVEEGGKRHTIRLVDPIENPDLQNLVSFLRTKAREARSRAGRQSPP